MVTRRKPTVLELAVAHAVCPVVKPWMDKKRGVPCAGCKPRRTSSGTGLPLCLMVCLDVARAALAVGGEPVAEAAAEDAA